MPLCHASKACKEVVIPDKKGNPIGGLTCKSFCNNVALPPGYEWWRSPEVNGSLSQPPRYATFIDTDTGLVYALTREECREVARAYRRTWGRG